MDDHESAAAISREKQLHKEHAAAHAKAEAELRQSNAEEKRRILTTHAKVDDRESAHGGGRALPFPTVETATRPQSSRGSAATRKAAPSVNDASAPARSPDFRQQALDAKQRGTEARNPGGCQGLGEAQVARASEAVSKRYAGLNRGAHSPELGA